MAEVGGGGGWGVFLRGCRPALQVCRWPVISAASFERTRECPWLTVPALRQRRSGLREAYRSSAEYCTRARSTLWEETELPLGNDLCSRAAEGVPPRGR